MLFCADADNINPSMWIGNITSLQNGLITPRTGGQANIITIDTTNVVRLLLCMYENWSGDT